MQAKDEVSDGGNTRETGIEADSAATAGVTEPTPHLWAWESVGRDGEAPAALTAAASTINNRDRCATQPPSPHSYWGLGRTASCAHVLESKATPIMWRAAPFPPASATQAAVEVTTRHQTRNRPRGVSDRSTRKAARSGKEVPY